MSDFWSGLASPFFALLDFVLDAPAAALVIGSAVVLGFVAFAAI